MPGSNPKSRRKLTVDGPSPGRPPGRGKRSSAPRSLTPAERIRQLEGRVGDLEAALRALLDSTGTAPQQESRYAPVHIQGAPLSSTILRDRGTN
jgi:hypothetical protein